MLVLRYLQLMSTFGWPLSDLAALLRYQLFLYRDLFGRLNHTLRRPAATARRSQSSPESGDYVVVGRQNEGTHTGATANKDDADKAFGELL